MADVACGFLDHVKERPAQGDTLLKGMDIGKDSVQWRAGDDAIALVVRRHRVLYHVLAGLPGFEAPLIRRMRDADRVVTQQVLLEPAALDAGEVLQEPDEGERGRG